MRIIGQENLAAMFGVTARTITDWQTAGMPIVVQGGPGTSGEYESASCIRWAIERELTKVRGENPKDRLARLQGDELEMDLAVRRGKLIEASTVEPAMRAAIVSAREKLRNEPARLAAALEGKSRWEREATLRELFDQVLTKLAYWEHTDPERDDGANENVA